MPLATRNTCKVCGGNTGTRVSLRVHDCYCDPEDVDEDAETEAFEDSIMDREEPGQMLTDEFW